MVLQLNLQCTILIGWYWEIPRFASNVNGKLLKSRSSSNTF